MNKIEELDITQVTNDICEFFDEEGLGTDSKLIRGLVEDWAVAKYPLYKKMGHRLRVSSTEVSVESLSEMSNFDEVLFEIGSNHNRKSVGDDRHRAVSLLMERLRIFSRGDSDLMSRIAENRAYEKAEELERMVIFITQTYHANPEDSFGWTNQARLTRQVGMVLRDMITDIEKQIEGFKTKPLKRNASEQQLADGDYIIGHEVASLERELTKVRDFSEVFNSGLSEIRQALLGEDKGAEFVVSIHPYDFVTSSFNQHGWSSCYSPEGSFAKSTLSLMTDRSTAVTYIPSTRELFKPYKVEQNSKKVRAFLHFDWNLEMAILSKVYPYSLKGYESAVAQTLVLNQILPSFRVWDYDPGKAEIYHSESMYADLRSSSTAFLITENFPGEFNSPPYSSWDIGETIGCMGCGDTEFMWEEYENGNEEGLSNWFCIECELGEDAFTCPHCQVRCSGEERADYDIEYVHCSGCESDYQAGYHGTPHEMSCDCDLCEDRRRACEELEAEEEDRRRELEKEQRLDEERLENLRLVQHS